MRARTAVDEAATLPAEEFSALYDEHFHEAKGTRPGDSTYEIEPDVTAATEEMAARDAAVIRESKDAPERFGVIFDGYFAEIHAYAARRIGPENARIGSPPTSGSSTPPRTC